MQGGAKFMMDEETKEVGKTPSTRHSHATEDFYEAIASGNYPEYTMYVQLMKPEEQKDYEFDIFDATKVSIDQFQASLLGRILFASLHEMTDAAQTESCIHKRVSSQPVK